MAELTASSRRTFDLEAAIAMAYAGLSNVAIAKEIGVDESRIRAAFRAVNFRRDLIPTDLEDRFIVELDKPLVITEDCGVAADFHIPLYDPAYVNEMILKLKDEGISTLVVGGDFLNMDELSRFEDKQPTANLERELDEAVNVMGVLTEAFDRIVYMWGNHDARLHTSLGMKLQFKHAMRLVFEPLGKDVLTKIEITNLDHAYYRGPNGEKWYICHPASYNRAPLTTARLLAAKLDCNVLTAHSHHSAVGYATNGHHVVAEIGGLFDRAKTQYLQRSTTNPVWTQGYALLKEGKLKVYSPGWSLG